MIGAYGSKGVHLLRATSEPPDELMLPEKRHIDVRHLRVGPGLKNSPSQPSKYPC